MKVIKTFVLDKTEEVKLCGNQMGDTVVGEVYFETNEPVDFSVQGACEDSDWKDMKLINMATYTLQDSAASAGIYMVPSAGLAKVKVNITGTGEVFVKENY